MSEIDAFVRTFFSVLAVFVVLIFFFFGFGLKSVEVFGWVFTLPLPTMQSFGVFVFEMIRDDLAPADVRIVATSPTSAFIAQFTVAIFLSFVASFPYAVYKIIKYIKPALHIREQNILLKVIVPSFVLFITGCLFSYFALIPPTLNILYMYADIAGVEPLLEIETFISFVVMLVLASGILFLLPIFMYILTKIGIVEPSFWVEKWRYALLLFLVLSAIITPDGSGVSMMILFVPLMVLYIVGVVVSSKKI